MNSKVSWNSIIWIAKSFHMFSIMGYFLCIVNSIHLKIKCDCVNTPVPWCVCSTDRKTNRGLWSTSTLWVVVMIPREPFGCKWPQWHFFVFQNEFKYISESLLTFKPGWITNNKRRRDFVKRWKSKPWTTGHPFTDTLTWKVWSDMFQYFNNQWDTSMMGRPFYILHQKNTYF